MHVVGHYHDFFSPSQLRYILGTYIMAWRIFFFQSKKEISVKSHYIQYLIHPQYNHLLQVIFLAYITYVLSIQSGVS